MSSFSRIATLVLLTTATACTAEPGAEPQPPPPALAPPSNAAFGFTPSNIDDLLERLDLSALVDIDVAAKDNEAGVSCRSQKDSSDTGGGCIATVVKQSDGSELQVYVAKSWRIAEGATLRVPDKLPVVLVASTTFEVLGTIDASSRQIDDNAGGRGPVVTPEGGQDGAGEGGGGRATYETKGAGIGAGGGSFCGTGGAGGGAGNGMGASRARYGAPSLIPLLAGSAGGSGVTLGGAGGGAVQIVARTRIDVRGTIHAGGGGGTNGGAPSAGQGAAGGGSGGAILLESADVNVTGTLAANGGGGGGASRPGDDATASTARALGGDGAARGGMGGALSASDVNGENGTRGVDDAFASSGGGGGAGYIRINTRAGSAALGGTISPSLGACASQGTLR